MQVIYATGRPRDLDFAIVNGREAVPAGAIVFASCDGDRLVPQLDKTSSRPSPTRGISPTWRSCARPAEPEKKRLREQPATAARRFVNRPSGLVAEDTAIHQSGS